jgi:subtilisin family serine protease
LSGGRSTFRGTSQASPHAAGAAALLLELNPGLGPDQLEALLVATGRPVLDPRNGLTFPRVDVAAAATRAAVGAR